MLQLLPTRLSAGPPIRGAVNLQKRVRKQPEGVAKKPSAKERIAKCRGLKGRGKADASQRSAVMRGLGEKRLEL